MCALLVVLVVVYYGHRMSIITDSQGDGERKKNEKVIYYIHTVTPVIGRCAGQRDREEGRERHGDDVLLAIFSSFALTDHTVFCLYLCNPTTTTVSE